MKKKKDAHTEGEEEDEIFLNKDDLMLKVDCPLRRDNVADLMKVFHRLGTHHYQLANGYIKPYVFDFICEYNSVNCAKALFKGKMGFKVDPNARFSHGPFPIHKAASRMSYDMIRLLLSHGADANVRTIGPIIPGGLLPLNIAVQNARLHKYLECWTVKDSVYKLIILISLPEMKPFLDVVRLLAEHTNCTLDELLRYIKHEKFFHMAILMTAAWRKISSTPIPDTDGGGSAMDVISGCIDKMVLSANEQERGLGHGRNNSKYVRPLNERKNVLALMSSFLNVYKKIGNKLYRYVRSVNSKVSRDEVVEQVTSLLKQQGFIVKNDDAALSNLSWYCDDSSRKLFESAGIKLESTGSTDFPLNEIYKIRKAPCDGYKMPSKRAVGNLLIESFYRRCNSMLSGNCRLQSTWPRGRLYGIVLDSMSCCQNNLYSNLMREEKKQCFYSLLGCLNSRRGYCTAASMVTKVLRRI